MLKKKIFAITATWSEIEKARIECSSFLETVKLKPERAHAITMVLSELIENAIKYGIARAEGGGHLKISAKVFAGDLLMEVSDDGPGCKLVNNNIPDAKGVGLRNTRERLAAIYGSEHSIKLSQTDPHGLTICIRIPFTPRHQPA